ncbi:LexA family protein [Paraburkholderia sp. BR10872]|uniref:LexA family protein n=1 Tax=Paraburkholderia sp. BR10872 TaxID=3236989 RepID=UPI0034D35E92
MKSIDDIRRENLEILIDERCEGNESELSRRLGYERPTMVNHWTAGRKNMSSASARRIEQTLELPEFWMDSDRGLYLRTRAAVKHTSATHDSAIKHSKSAVIKELPTAGRNNLSGVGRDEYDQNVAPAPTGQRRIPIISYVQAGMMTEAMDPFALGDGFEVILADLDVSNGTFALRIKGDSMRDRFSEGDVVIIDPEVEPLPGDFVVAKNTNEEATFKKYRPRGSDVRGDMIFELVPLNDDYPTLHSERDHLRVIGVMVEHRQYRKR